MSAALLSKKFHGKATKKVRELNSHKRAVGYLIKVVRPLSSVLPSFVLHLLDPVYYYEWLKLQINLRLKIYYNSFCTTKFRRYILDAEKMSPPRRNRSTIAHASEAMLAQGCTTSAIRSCEHLVYIVRFATLQRLASRRQFYL